MSQNRAHRRSSRPEPASTDDGAVEGAVYGTIDGAIDGAIDGVIEGATDVTPPAIDGERIPIDDGCIAEDPCGIWLASRLAPGLAPGAPEVNLELSDKRFYRK